jgi:hypothetical protein
MFWKNDRNVPKKSPNSLLPDVEKDLQILVFNVRFFGKKETKLQILILKTFRINFSLNGDVTTNLVALPLLLTQLTHPMY